MYLHRDDRKTIMIQTYSARFVYKKELTDDVYLFRFHLESGQVVQYLAGQYLILMVPQAGEEMARRLYSILTPPDKGDYFEMVIEILPNGLASNYLMNLQEHESVVFKGPAGIFIIKESDRHKVFLATGTGIAPIKSMIEVLCRKSDTKTPIYLFWGVPRFKDVYFFKELQELSTIYNNLHISICLSQEPSLEGIAEIDRKYFTLGRVTKAFDQLLTTNSQLLIAADYYVCGGRTVVESLRQYLSGKEIPREAVHFEKF